MKVIYRLACAGLLLIILNGCQQNQPSSDAAPSPTDSSPQTAAKEQQQPLPQQIQSVSAPVADQPAPTSQTASAIDWTQPSGGPYPELKKGETIWLDVSIQDQRVYVKDGDQILYTMVMSSGLDTSPDDTSPQGTYYIEPERGTWFYSKKVKEGAMYWVSWKNHGEFLFHSVPMDEDKQVIVDEAKKLGEKASHGCFRLTIPDAKWIYDHVPTKTKVVVGA